MRITCYPMTLLRRQVLAAASGLFRTGFLGTACFLAVGCGPKAVESPAWTTGPASIYPTSLFVLGVGSAPTSAGVSEALKAASSSARSEIAQIFQVQIQHVEELLVESESKRSSVDQASWTIETERSILSSYSKSSTDQIIQGIELKEKYQDNRAGILYVLAILDRAEAAQRLRRELGRFTEEIATLTERAAERKATGDLLETIKLYREALSSSVRADLVRRQLGVVEPRTLWEETPRGECGRLAAYLSDLLLQLEFFVDVEGDRLIEASIHQALSETEFSIRMDPSPIGLTLWGRVDIRWDTYPALRGGVDLQVCRADLGIKVLDNVTNRIVGQVNLLSNSNAQEKARAQERALRLLSQQIIETLPERLYEALSVRAY